MARQRLPEPELEHNAEYERWQLEAALAEWEADEDNAAEYHQLRQEEEDEEATERFRHLLLIHNVVYPRAYVWHQGKALYHGEPLTGETTPSEDKAIARMDTETRQKRAA